MGLSFDISVPALTIFAQGLPSLLSPCALPLLLPYLSYLAGGGKHVGEDGRVYYPRRQVFTNTLFFIIGIGFISFLLGSGLTALGKFLNSNRTVFARISGIIMVMFGLYQFGFFGGSKMLGEEYRMFLKLDRWPMGSISTLLLGFTSSFAWTSRVGSVLSSAMLMAGTTSSMGKAVMLIGVYTLGFTLSFLVVGLLITTLLDFFKKYGSAVRYAVKVGVMLLIFMGIMTFTGLMDSFTGYFSSPGGFFPGSSTAKEQTTAVVEILSTGEENTETMPAQPENADDTEASIAAAESSSTAEETTTVAPTLIPDFTLVDQNGEIHTLPDYQGKIVPLNFWAIWCLPCRGEMSEIQALYERHGSNEEDLIVFGVAGPNQDQEGDVDHITSFLSEQGYTFPVVMDETGDIFYNYSMYSYPITFIIDKDGNIFDYASGVLFADMMEGIVKQTMDGKLVLQ